MKNNNTWKLISLKLLTVILLVGSLYMLNRPKIIMIEHANADEEKPILNPALMPVCSCESSYEGGPDNEPQQFELDGVTVRHGRVNSNDRGMCQINRTIHASSAIKLGMNIETEKGNIEYANYLYENEGLKPWSWSKSCWEK